MNIYGGHIMEWKKEKISASELEKRQKEYMNEALAMMKRGSTVSVSVQSHTIEQTLDVHKEPDDEHTDTEQVSEEVREEISGTEEKPVQEELLPTEAMDDESEQCEEDDDKYGVYTADEIMNGEHDSEGLKKAAEILEEMTRSTEMMKRFADGEEDDDSGTTDFPDFSCDMTDEGDRFRQDSSGSSEELTKEKLVPKDE